LVVAAGPRAPESRFTVDPVVVAGEAESHLFWLLRYPQMKLLLAVQVEPVPLVS
jgi:hypothetical protein